MHPKIKTRPSPEGNLAQRVEPLLPHEAIQQSASINPSARSNNMPKAIQPASGSANHARHHVSRHTQS